MKKRRQKNTLSHGRGKPQRQPKGSFTRKTEGDANDFGGSDVDSDEFYHDEIDDFHAHQEKVLLGDDKGFNAGLSSGEEEEVMPITDEEGDEDDIDEEVAEDGFEEEDEDDQTSVHKSDMESDLDDKSDDDDGLPSLTAWGKKKSLYYGADFVDRDRGKSYRPEDEEKALAEEAAGTEIRKIYDRIIKNQSAHYDNVFMVYQKPEEDRHATVKDFSNLTKEDHKQNLKKESPEFFLLVDDFKILMKELTEHVSPLFKLVEDGQISGKGAEHVKTKRSLILHYCMNICFYMMLMANNSPVKYHPVMKRLSQYKKLLNQFEDIDKKVKSETDYMLEKLKAGESIEFISEVQSKCEGESLPLDSSASPKQITSKRPVEESTSPVLKKSKKQKVEKLSKSFETETEMEVSELYMDMKKRQKDTRLLLGSDDESWDEEQHDVNEDEELEEFDKEGDGKRTITYEIAKNKGLLPYRKKEYRNPRVRNRMKYRQAKIRRKGQVREPRKEITRYGGEITGIRTDVAKSIKIK